MTNLELVTDSYQLLIKHLESLLEEQLKRATAQENKDAN